jgi:hypothetical protein
MQAVRSLDQHLKRCPVALGSMGRDQAVPVLRYGRTPHYRIFFTVDDAARLERVYT